LKTYCVAIGVWAVVSFAAAGCHDDLGGPTGSGGRGGTGGAGGTVGSNGAGGACGQVPVCFADCANDPVLGVCQADGTVTCPAHTQPMHWCTSGTGGASSGTGGASSGTGGFNTGTGGSSSGSGGTPGTGGASATGGASGTGGTTGAGGAGGIIGVGGRAGGSAGGAGSGHAGGQAGGSAGGAGGGHAGGQAGSGIPSQHRPTATVCPGSVKDGGSMCTTDEDCPNGGVCSCGSTQGDAGVNPGNVCVPANCRIDSDCGPGGYCSPTFSNGCLSGVQGYYCHTAGDHCRNDTDCVPNAHCAYSQQESIWACASSLCFN
jgi:hypothetical protein